MGYGIPFNFYERYGYLCWFEITTPVTRTRSAQEVFVHVGTPVYGIHTTELYVTILLSLVFTGLAILIIKWLPRPVNYAACHECGYNLTGNTTGKCPECGEDVLCDEASSHRSPLPPGEG